MHFYREEDEEDEEEEYTSDGKKKESMKKHYIKFALKWGVFLAFHIYLVVCIVYHVKNELNFEWCDGLGFVIIITATTYAYFGSSFLHNLINETPPYLKFKKFLSNSSKKLTSNKYVSAIIYLMVWVLIFGFLIIDTWGHTMRMVSVGGIFLLLAFGAAISKHKRKISFRQVTWGIVMQFILAIFILRWNIGRHVLEVNTILNMILVSLFMLLCICSVWEKK